MNSTIHLIHHIPKCLNDFYCKCLLEISNFKIEEESHSYQACHFHLGLLKVLSRKAKITPKKVGQFVTLWNRSAQGITQPYSENDNFDLVIINVSGRTNQNYGGQFVFTKSVLLEKGILSSPNTGGKRGFRVYSPWDKTTSQQAMQTQKWQDEYFLPFGVGEVLDLALAEKLYGIE